MAAFSCHLVPPRHINKIRKRKRLLRSHNSISLSRQFNSKLKHQTPVWRSQVRFRGPSRTSFTQCEVINQHSTKNPNSLLHLLLLHRRRNHNVHKPSLKNCRKLNNTTSTSPCLEKNRKWSTYKLCSQCLEVNSWN